MTYEIEEPSLDDTKAFLAAECGTYRPPGRPKGTGFQKLDAPFHERMRELLKNGMASSITAAARMVAEHAVGASFAAKVDRLVRGYPF